MLRSMTGFGKSNQQTPLGTLEIQVQSVNRKYLETAMWMSKDFFQFEVSLKKLIGEQVFRGYVTVRVQLISNEKSLGSLLPEIGVLKSLKEEWEKRAEELNIPAEEISLSFLAEQSRDFTQKSKKEIDKFFSYLKGGVNEATTACCVMKDKEGKALEKDILSRLKIIEKKVKKIEKLAPKQIKTHQQKLEDKLADFLQANGDSKDVLLREILLFTDKVDITEEIVRFHSHIIQFESCVTSDEKSKGKKLDFLLQEFNREVHTMGSKSNDVEISSLVIECKSELEKIREQLQNVE